jgi:hypothetical protein
MSDMVGKIDALPIQALIKVMSKETKQRKML